MMFRQMEGDSVVLVRGGVYFPADLYERNGGLFAKSGAGFVRLYADGSTSNPKVRIDTLISMVDLYRDTFGRLWTKAVDRSTKLTEQQLAKLAVSY